MTWWQQVALNIFTSMIPAGGLLMLLRLGPERRKIGGEATMAEATAAATLTGSALSMVKHAEERAESAENKADHAEAEAAEAHRMAMLAQQRLSRLVAWIRTQGMDPPSWVED